MRILTKITLPAILAAGMTLSAHAFTIPAFLSANPNVAGLVGDAVPFGDADRVTYVNNLLGLGANAFATTIGTELYYTGPIDYNGTVSLADSMLGTGVATISGWDYVFVKYDGPNAGALVYVLNGASITLASDIDALGGITDATKDWKGGISGWTAYGRHGVPDGGSTMALMGLGLASLGLIRRKLN